MSRKTYSVSGDEINENEENTMNENHKTNLVDLNNLTPEQIAEINKRYPAPTQASAPTAHYLNKLSMVVESKAYSPTYDAAKGLFTVGVLLFPASMRKGTVAIKGKISYDGEGAEKLAKLITQVDYKTKLGEDTYLRCEGGEGIGQAGISDKTNSVWANVSYLPDVVFKRIPNSDIELELLRKDEDGNYRLGIDVI